MSQKEKLNVVKLVACEAITKPLSRLDKQKLFVWLALFSAGVAFWVSALYGVRLLIEQLTKLGE